MKKACCGFILFLLVAIVLTGCAGQTEAVEVNISAAASMTDALMEIQTEYATVSDAVLQFNFAGSGALQKQIEEGAPCDLFISASKANMDELEEAGLIEADSRKDLLGNTLTLIVSAEKADAIEGYETLAAVDSIAIGAPESVPAGKYAKQALESLDIWDQIQDKIVFAKDVKQVLEYVDTGNVDCGIVYRTDALMMETGVTAAELPEDSHDPIVYPAALIKDSVQGEAASGFYQFLQTDFAKGIFEKYGFIVY